ncbi:MAG: plastocyanin/azurin family copper-binding protein [Planctomycetota bacterium]
MKSNLALAAVLALGGSLSAQITQDVALTGFDFIDATSLTGDTVINVGDTVRWTWFEGLHDVKSGSGGIANGIFDSGNPVLPPQTFEITFDQAFLDANPVPGNVYEYYCSIHVSFGMDGTVTVNTPPNVSTYGCLNPPNSLIEIGGVPAVGQVWTVGVDNPIAGAQPPGSLAFVSVSLFPAPGFPCGLPLPGFHMDPLLPNGELLINLAAPDPLVSLGPTPWAGPGTPAQFPIPIPPNPALAGFQLHLQGLVLDPVGPNTFGATNGIQVTLGS